MFVLPNIFSFIVLPAKVFFSFRKIQYANIVYPLPPTFPCNTSYTTVFFQSSVVFSRSKCFPVASIYPANIFLSKLVSTSNILSSYVSYFYSSLSEYLPCNNFFHNVYQPQTYYPLRYSLSVTVSPHPIDFNDFLRQCFISLVTSFPLPENIYLPWIYFYHFSSVVFHRVRTLNKLCLSTHTDWKLLECCLPYYLFISIVSIS